MNFNTSFSDPNREIFTGVKFTFENFEELTLDSSYVENFDVFTSDPERNEYALVMLILSRQMKKEASDAYEIITKRKDITYVDILGINQYGESVTITSIRVPYKEDENGDNLYQEYGEFESGETYLQFNEDLIGGEGGL